MSKFCAEDCRLRPVQRCDTNRLLAWRNSDRVRVNMYNCHLIGGKEHEIWFQSMLKDASCCYLIFEYRDRPVGLVYFMDIDRTNRKARWGFYLGEMDIPKGLGSVMGLLSLDYIFAEFNLRKLDGEVIEFNHESIAFHKKLGFKIIDRYIDYIKRGDISYDVISLRLTQKQWLEVRPLLAERLFGYGAYAVE